ncbi:beta strand repeat-containing protein [Geomonas limicola]|uniref:beta strand repeat-containing protein n=1 Tax=Geomonas limicola TaxID=2740186 RepID=UPI00160F98E5|nr:fibronectin type III domain-containing protein [Geomonas limicola]
MLFIATLITAQLLLNGVTAHAAQATMSWSAPTTYSDGSALSGLKGYKLYTGTASGSYSNPVDVGNANSYTMTGLNDGATYYFAVTAYDSLGNTSGYSNEIKLTTPATAGSGGSASAYTVTASAGSGGSITPSGATVVSSGASQAYTVTPATGYYISSVTVDGTQVAANIAGGAPYSYSFTNVSASHTIAASFAVRSYHIVASAGSNGTVSPADTWAVYNTSQTISITPASGYQVADVTVDGKSVGPVTSYTFNNLAADHTVAATFGNQGYTITASAGANGSITPTGTATVSAGSTPTYTVTPATGYYVASVTVDGTAVVSNIPGGAGYSYTFTSVAASHTLSASFAMRSYHVVATAGTGGSVTPPDSWVAYNTSQTIGITPASGYQVADVAVDGKSVGAVTSYTFNNLSADHTVAATFAAGYSITASAGANGTITPTGTSAVTAGSSKTYTITPNTGYYLQSVVVDGTTVASNVPGGAAYSYTFNNLSGSHTISATFDVRYYNIATTAGTGGSITAGSWALYNTSPVITITPASGKKIASVTVDGVSVGALSSYTFSNVSADHAISATFM